MNSVALAFILLVVLLLPVTIYVLVRKTTKHSPSPSPLRIERHINPKLQGLVLFDIDGTLTPDRSGKNNALVVEACLKRNFAVGVCTAGAVYTMSNLQTYSWMPEILYRFIKEHDSITFNNIASGYVAGKLNKKAYRFIDTVLDSEPLPFRTGWEYTGRRIGYKKGYALSQTASALGLSEPQDLFICDDEKTFLEGVKLYNNKLQTICCGQSCGEKSLTLHNVIKSLDR
tara:strand:- start:1537 stop:2223 length:687 start_codon:yes stop_codon:yes gene_type:complete